MATVKVTMIFKLETGSNTLPNDERLAGWSESWYYVGTVDAAERAANVAPGLCSKRAAMLPTGALIVGQRFQSVDPPGPALDRAKLWVGGNLKCDIPQMTLLTRVASSPVGYERVLLLRGVPDDAVSQGEYASIVGYDTPMRAFLSNLAPLWHWRAIDTTTPKANLVGIKAGVVTTEVAHTFVVGNVVNITRSKPLSLLPAYHGRQVVQAPVTSTTFGLVVNPKFGDSVGGKVRPYAITYPTADGNVQDIELSVTTRKVGRPLGEYRGRR